MDMNSEYDGTALEKKVLRKNWIAMPIIFALMLASFPIIDILRANFPAINALFGGRKVVPLQMEYLAAYYVMLVVFFTVLCYCFREIVLGKRKKQKKKEKNQADSYEIPPVYFAIRL
jgi:membrane protein implicated in regulation of membrane protease activity